jgi:hypothetical protein
MPYKLVGKTVMHKKDGWSKKQTAKSIPNAKKSLRLLNAIEHGWKPTGKKTKGKTKAGPHSPTTFGEINIGITKLIGS